MLCEKYNNINRANTRIFTVNVLIVPVISAAIMDPKGKQTQNVTKVKKATRKPYKRNPLLLNNKYLAGAASDSEKKKQLIQPSQESPHICRVCMNEGDIPIFGDDSIADISGSLKKYGDIEIDVDDLFPKYLCHDCHEQLQSAIKFTQTAQETDQILRDSWVLEDKEDLDYQVQVEVVYEEDFFKETLTDLNTVYNCRSCQLDFTSSNEYGKHMFLKNHDTKDKCPFCCREYACILKHLALHKLYETLLCDICEQKFLRPNFLRHQEGHHEILPFKCSKCPYRTRYHSDFKVHMRKHTGERPYKCSDCSACFVSKSNLNRHILTHNSTFEFKCKECDKGFYNQRQLGTHVKVSHGGIKDHLCNLCGKTFGYRKYLMKHLLKVHKREKLRSGKTPVYLRFKQEKDDNVKYDDTDESNDDYTEYLG